jgi:hypothetical protein
MNMDKFIAALEFRANDRLSNTGHNIRKFSDAMADRNALIGSLLRDIIDALKEARE